MPSEREISERRKALAEALRRGNVNTFDSANSDASSRKTVVGEMKVMLTEHETSERRKLIANALRNGDAIVCDKNGTTITSREVIDNEFLTDTSEFGVLNRKHSYYQDCYFCLLKNIGQHQAGKPEHELSFLEAEKSRILLILEEIEMQIKKIRPGYIFVPNLTPHSFSP